MLTSTAVDVNMFQVLTCSVAIILITWLANMNYNVKKLTVPVPEITRNLAYDIGGRHKAIPKYVY